MHERTSYAGAIATSATTYLLIVIAAAMASTSCAATTTEIPVRGEPTSMTALVGEWDGSYTSRDTGRSGSIWFKLTPGEDHAHGDVLMTPRDAEPYRHYDPQSRLDSARVPLTEFLTIRFVVVRNGDLRGELEPYLGSRVALPGDHDVHGHFS